MMAMVRHSKLIAVKIANLQDKERTRLLPDICHMQVGGKLQQASEGSRGPTPRGRVLHIYVKDAKYLHTLLRCA